MTISEMYENNKNVKDLEEEIANHNAVIASGKKVGEMYFEQLKSMKEKYSSMSVISEKQIDDKVNEYEKKLDEYEKNNNRINELSELIESHNAMVISGRQVSEGYFKQIEEYKKELASMREIPHNKIMAYKRELAIAYKEKIKSAPEINKRYDETKEMVENHRAMFASGRIVGEKYGEQLVNNENKISELKRVSKTDIDKWEKVIEDVEKDDKEIGKLKELIETQQSLMVSGIIGGKDAVKKQDELKRQLKERMISVKEIEENDKTVKDQGNNLPAIIKKENIVTKIKNSKLAEVFKNLGSKISNIFSKNKKDEKVEENSEVIDKSKEYREKVKKECQEDNEQAKKYAEELVREANAVHMPAENIVNDCKFYLAVNKVLDQYDCNAFTIPCFEMCATRELNKRHLTFCLTNSLLKDDGIPAACAADVGSVISLDIMMNIARKSPHMGNCMVMVKDIENNTMRILHDVATRCMKGYDNPDKVDYVSFTKGNWGATMRYDFAKDAGETITMINISPKMDKIMIAKGEITGCDDFLTQECKHAVVFKVKDARDFHAKQEYFGQHYVWVYGDYTEDLKAFAKLMGIEAVLA